MPLSLKPEWTRLHVLLKFRAGHCCALQLVSDSHFLSYFCWLYWSNSALCSGTKVSFMFLELFL